MLTDVAQKIQHVDIGGPIQIIDDQGRIIAIEVNKLTDLIADFLHPTRHHIGCIQLTFGSFKAGVSDQTCSAPNQSDWAMPRFLKTTQDQQRHQRSDVQAVCRGIEAAIQGAGLSGEPLIDKIFTGNLKNQIAGAEVG